MKTLVIDVGNTHLHFCVFENGFTVSKSPEVIGHDDLEKLDLKLIKKIYLSCGINEIANKIKELAIKKDVKVFEMNSSSQTSISSTYNTLGTDRISNLTGALNHEDYNGNDYIVVFDFGTATTVTVCDKDRKFLGGLIKPGVQTELKSLFFNTKTLPNILIQNVTLTPFAINTEDAILNGVIFDHIGFIEKYLAEFYDKYKVAPQVFFTGGNAQLISSLFPRKVILDPLLTLKGVYFCTEELYSQEFVAK